MISTAGKPLASDLERSLRVFLSPGDVAEVRCLNVPSRGRDYTASGYFDDLTAAGQAAEKYDSVKAGGCYFVLNQLDPSLLARSENTVKQYPKATTADREIIRRRWLLVDLDPDRPAGIGSNEAELEAANEATEILWQYLCGEIGWSEPVKAMSGNGYHLLFPIDLPNDDESTELVKLVLLGIQACLDKRHPTDLPRIAVDTSVFNAARITKLYGTTSRKGSSTADRPHRRSELIYVPDYLDNGWSSVDAIPKVRLRAVAALAPVANGHHSLKANGHAKQAETGHAPAVAGGFPRLMVDQWLNDRQVGFSVKQSTDGRNVYKIQCPFNESHGGKGETSVMQAANGRMSANCMHDSCSGRGWQDFKQSIGPPEPHHYNPPLGPQKVKVKSTPIPAGTMVRAADRDNFGTVVIDHGASCTVRFVSTEGNAATVELTKSDLRLQDGSPADPSAVTPTKFDLISSREFAETKYDQRFLINNVLVEGQPAIVGGRSKTMKTTFMVDAAISLGTGSPFLGKFETKPSTVALLSGESGAFTIQETARRIALAKGVSLAMASVCWGFQLPQIALDGDLTGLGEELLANSIDVLMIDPAYLCLLAGDVRGLNSSNVFDMGPLLLSLSELGQKTNCTIVLCHHCRKNSAAEQFSPPELEELSMAGFAEWARQWLLLGRREQYDQGSGIHRLWLNIGGSAGHSGCYGVDVDEGKLNDDFTGRKWEVNVSTAADARQEAKHNREKQKHDQQAKKVEEHKQKIIEALSLSPEGDTSTGIRSNGGLNGDSFRTAILALKKTGEVENCIVTKNKREYEGYRLVPDSAPRQPRQTQTVRPDSLFE